MMVHSMNQDSFLMNMPIVTIEFGFSIKITKVYHLHEISLLNKLRKMEAFILWLSAILTMWLPLIFCGFTRMG